MSFSGNKVPKGYGVAQVQQFTPDQMKLLGRLMEQLGPEGFLSRIANGDQSEFDAVEAPAKRQFAGAVGNLGSRFAGMGTGALKSSGFNNTASQAASNFAQDLQSNRYDMRMNAIKDLQSAGNALLNQRPYNTGVYQKPKKQGFDWGNLISAAAPIIGSFFGPAGTAAGVAASGTTRAANNYGYGVAQGQKLPGFMEGY